VALTAKDQDDGWLKRHQFCGMGAKTLGIAVASAVVDLQDFDQPSRACLV
jgi:hypothetical protein